MITGLSHVSMKNGDLEAAVRFYVEGLGLELAEKTDKWAKVLLPDGTFLEIAGEGENVSNKSGITHICFDTYDCDATFARAIEYGAVASRGDAYDLGELRISFVTAPTGEEVEFWYVSHGDVHREPIVGNHYVKSFVHVALTVPNMDACIAFYDKLGVPFKTGWGWGCSIRMQDKRELELFTEGAYTRNQNGITHFCLWCENIEETLALALSLGAKPHVEIKDVPSLGVKLAFFIGLAGEEVELFQKV